VEANPGGPSSPLKIKGKVYIMRLTPSFPLELFKIGRYIN